MISRQVTPLRKTVFVKEGEKGGKGRRREREKQGEKGEWRKGEGRGDNKITNKGAAIDKPPTNLHGSKH